VKRSYSYRLGLRDGWLLARGTANQFDPPPGSEAAEQAGWPNGTDPDEYREGYRDGIARHEEGKRSPRIKILP